MKFHILTYGRKNNLTSTTEANLFLLQEAAKDCGVSTELIYSRSSQVQFTPSLQVYSEGKRKRINTLLSRPNFLHSNLELHSAFINQFQLSGANVINKSDPVRKAKNKFEMHQVIANAELPMPKTYIVRSGENIGRLVEKMGNYPLILKTLSGSHGAGVFIAESKRSLRSILGMFLGPGKSSFIILQEYIRESAGEDIRAFVVGDRVVASMKRSASTRGEFRSNFNLGGSVEEIDLSKKEHKLAVSATKAFGLDIAGVDLLQSDDGPLVLEVNANPGIEGITKATDTDVAKKIVEFVINK